MWGPEVNIWFYETFSVVKFNYILATINNFRCKSTFSNNISLQKFNVYFNAKQILFNANKLKWNKLKNHIKNIFWNDVEEI